MAQWIVLKTDNGIEHINLNMANRIIFNQRKAEYSIEFNNGRVTIARESNPATFAHISAFLGVEPESA